MKKVAKDCLFAVEERNKKNVREIECKLPCLSNLIIRVSVYYRTKTTEL